MSCRPLPLARRSLAIGAALAGCSLAATDAQAVNMNFTTLDSASGFMSLGSVSVPFSVSSATSYWSDYRAVTNGYFNGGATGVYGMDVISVQLNLNSAYTSGVGLGSFTLTFASAVTFTDYGVLYGGFNSTAWTVGGSAVSDGQQFAAGTYTFDYSFLYSGASTQIYMIGALFNKAPAGGVPLPGAAGLAACGLVGLSRRRRR